MQNNEDTARGKFALFRRRRTKIIVAAVAALLVFAFGPALLSEGSTVMYEEEFSDVMLDGFGDHRKVLSYSFDSAKIYAYSTGDKEGEQALGGIVRLKREYNEYETGPWEIVGWEPMWTDDGQHNDRVVWQYWWHFLYFL